MKQLSPAEKIFRTKDLVALQRKCRDLQSAGKKLVFTNGCFDILHRGHVQYLNEAAGLGDFLLIGINTDDSVSRLKGPERPVNTTEDRAFVLAGLACCDAVVFFQEDTPLSLIEILSPDVLVKGGDYKESNIAGAEFVKSKGGKVVIIPFVSGYSTTDTIRKING